MRTSGLHQERDEIPHDENLREPRAPDQRVVLSAGHQHDSTEFHVDASREQRRADENEDRLDGQRREGIVWVFV